MVTNVMENLVKRVLIAESETAREKEKVYFSQEEIKKKDSQLESMSLKLKEMERCAFGTNGILNEMRQRVEDTVNKTSRQRQRAAENEQELTRVKRDFGNMKSYVSSLISVRETLVSSEKQFQTIEKFFERLQNAPPVTYTEHKEEKSKRSRDIVLEEGAKPEFYTEEDEKLLGNTEMPWTFFVDGYRKDGTRIYDLVNGKTCDQCRQKTLGQRTRCFKCNLVQGQFCGDCLFMRYGEHVVEAKQNPEWVCPPCRGICNCSLCRQAKGWAPTGALYRKVIGLGFRSVAHYLVSTKRAPPEPDKSLSNAPQPAKRSLPFEGMELHKDDNGCNIKAAVKRTKINPQSERHNQT